MIIDSANSGKMNQEGISSKWESFNGNRKIMLTMESAKHNSGVIKLRDTFDKQEERSSEEHQRMQAAT